MPGTARVGQGLGSEPGRETRRAGNLRAPQGTKQEGTRHQKPINSRCKNGLDAGAFGPIAEQSKSQGEINEIGLCSATPMTICENHRNSSILELNLTRLERVDPIVCGC